MAGILGQLFGLDVQGDGILGKLGRGLSENSNTLLGYGLGGSDGLQQGMVADQRARAFAQAQAEQERERVTAQQLAAKLGTPELAGMPELVKSAYLQKLSQGAPTEIQRNLSALGLKPGTDEYKTAYLKLSGLGKATASWGVIGKDDYGNEQYGWIDPSAQRVTPGQSAPSSPQVAQTDGPAIPPPPPGVNPKIWRDEQTKAIAQQGQQTPEMKNKLAAAEKSAADLSSSLDNYNTLVQKYGAEAWNGPAKAQMQTAYTDVLIKMKEAANLGVLNGPDLELMQKQLEEATVSGFDRVNPVKQWGIGERVGAQVGQIKKSVGQGLDNARRVYGGKASASQATKGKTQSGITWSAN